MTFEYDGELLEVELKEPDDFLKVKETLTRIGVAAARSNRLYQSCHVLHRRGHYYIVHFKELFVLDGRPADISEDDIGRRNTIAKLLQDWKLLKIVQQESPTPSAKMTHIKVIAYKDKEAWELIPKYRIGNTKKVSHEAE